MSYISQHIFYIYKYIKILSGTYASTILAFCFARKIFICFYNRFLKLFKVDNSIKRTLINFEIRYNY